jgi:hypothetical protein
MNEDKELLKKIAGYVLELSARVRLLENSQNQIKKSDEYTSLLNSLYSDLKQMFELKKEIESK